MKKNENQENSIGRGTKQILCRTKEIREQKIQTHRVLFMRLKALPANETTILVGLEVAKPHNNRIRIECGGNATNSFG